MARIRFRLRTLMIIVAFVAIVFVAVIQGYYIKRAEVRMETHQAEGANVRAAAEHQLARAEKQAAAARHMFELLQKAKVGGEQMEGAIAPGGLERERRGDRGSREGATTGSERPTGKS